MPLSRRMPKRGFGNARFATKYIAVNVEGLNRFAPGSTVDEALLREAGLARGPADGVKILGSGAVLHGLVVKASAFSATARAKIEKAGGSCQVVCGGKSAS